MYIDNNNKIVFKTSERMRQDNVFGANNISQYFLLFWIHFQRSAIV